MGALRVEYAYVYSCSFKSNRCIKLDETHAIMNNGITYNTKNKKVYVADTLKSVVRVYSIKPQKKDGLFDLAKEKEIQVNYMIDNLDYSEKDDLIYLSLLAKGIENLKLNAFIDQNHRFPYPEEKFEYHSGIGILNPNKETLEYPNFTTKIIGGSVAVKVNDYIFYGSFGDNALAICKIK